MSETGEKEPLLNTSRGNGVIDVTSVRSSSRSSLLISSVTSSAMIREEAAVHLLNSRHSDDFDESQRPDDLDDAWAYVSAKNLKKRQELPTSDVDTFIHLLKGNIGTGLLSLPYAILNGGIILGPLGLLVLGAIATHCMVLLVRCAGTLCKRNSITSLDYSETLQFALIEQGYNRLGKIARWVVNILLLITQFGFCAVYFVFIADNMHYVTYHAFNHVIICPKVWMVIFILPVALVSWIRYLKELAPASMLANLFMWTGLLIIIYEVVDQFVSGTAAVIKDPSSILMINEPLKVFKFLGMVFYSFEGIGVILPLENKMRHPSHAPRVITLGMTCVISLFIVFSVLCYMVFGADTANTVTTNLKASNDAKEIVFLIASLLISAATFVSYHLQFYVPLDFLEPIVLKRLYVLLYWFPGHAKAVKRGRIAVRVGFRTTLVIMTALLAIVIPFLDDLISLLGAVASSSLALTFPALIDLFTHWHVKHQKFLYIFPRPVWICKNLFIILLGVLGCVCGTLASVYSIVEDFSKVNNGTAGVCD